MDALKHAIASEVATRHSPATIRERSLKNLARWKSQGAWGAAYEEWETLLRTGDDDQLLQVMLGLDERANRMRQSMPYTGMLPREVVERSNREA